MAYNTDDDRATGKALKDNHIPFLLVYAFTFTYLDTNTICLLDNDHNEGKDYSNRAAYMAKKHSWAKDEVDTNGVSCCRNGPQFCNLDGDVDRKDSWDT